MKIDAVITWVDGDDPKHKLKRQTYGSHRILHTDDVAGSTRFRSVGEIFYCVASLNRFAPWINKIYIVTDEQNPQLDSFLSENFPEGHIPVEIIDHKVIFRGYEQYLPTFNSISIESMTWRIPGLSEHFIEFNDDLILAAPVTPEDFFTENGVVCYAGKRNSYLVALTRMLKYHRNGTKRITYKHTMLNAAKLLKNHPYILKMHHTPKALLRSFYENYFAENPETLHKNIEHRFRNVHQFNPQELQYLKLYQEGRCELRSVEDNLLYLYAKDSDTYITKKLEHFSSLEGCKFGCFNSIDQASENGCRMIIDWIKRRINLCCE